jgi:hypothetical protein
MANGLATPRLRGTHHPTSEDHNSVRSSIETAHEELTERSFLIPIKDSHGHSERVSLRVHPQYMPVLNNVLRSQKFPFRSTNDIVRYAIDRACRDLERRAEIPSMMRRIDAIRDLLAAEENNIEFLGIFETATRQIQNYINTGAQGEAAKIVTEMRHQIREMPAGYWRDRYERELLTRFKHLLEVDAGDGANLTNGDE